MWNVQLLKELLKNSAFGVIFCVLLVTLSTLDVTSTGTGDKRLSSCGRGGVGLRGGREAEAMVNNVLLRDFFCVDDTDLLYDRRELSFLWLLINIMCLASKPLSLR
jgi:hypothetical protein